MNRKTFLHTTIKAVGAGLLSGGLYGCKTVLAVPHRMEGQTIVVSKADFGENKSIIVQPVHLPAPVYLALLEDGQYSAVLMRCTHRSCEVRPAGTELQCPCHGSAFTHTGEVLEGPAERPLEKFTVRVDQEHIYIN